MPKSRCKGVPPYLSQELTFAPLLINTLATSSFPVIDAQPNGLSWCGLGSLTSAPWAGLPSIDAICEDGLSSGASTRSAGLRNDCLVSESES